MTSGPTGGFLSTNTHPLSLPGLIDTYRGPYCLLSGWQMLKLLSRGAAGILETFAGTQLSSCIKAGREGTIHIKATC